MKRCLTVIATIALTIGLLAPAAGATRNPKPCWRTPHPTCDWPIYP